MPNITQLASILFLVVTSVNGAFASANPPFEPTLSAARAGDPRAQYLTGMAYVFGQGTPPDIPQAVRWLQPSAAAGVPQALVALAGLYDVGCGVPLALDHAVVLRQQAARAGSSIARRLRRLDGRYPDCGTSSRRTEKP